MNCIHIFMHESFQSVSHGIVPRYRGRRTGKGRDGPLVHHLWWGFTTFGGEVVLESFV